MSTPHAPSRGICALLALPLAFILSTSGLKLSDGPNGVTLEIEGLDFCRPINQRPDNRTQRP